MRNIFLYHFPFPFLLFFSFSKLPKLNFSHMLHRTDRHLMVAFEDNFLVQAYFPVQSCPLHYYTILLHMICSIQDCAKFHYVNATLLSNIQCFSELKWCLFLLSIHFVIHLYLSNSSWSILWINSSSLICLELLIRVHFVHTNNFWYH